MSDTSDCPRCTDGTTAAGTPCQACAGSGVVTCSCGECSGGVTLELAVHHSGGACIGIDIEERLCRRSRPATPAEAAEHMDWSAPAAAFGAA